MRNTPEPEVAIQLLGDQQPLACIVLGCERERQHGRKGYCSVHYYRQQRFGDPLHTPSGRQWGMRRTCVVPGCGRVWDGHGYCLKHYKLWRRWGDPAARQPKRGSYINSGGYRKVLRSDHPGADAKGYILEHRLVMSEVLGRPLGRHEIVHHKNGVRTDNARENLEVLTREKHHTGHQHCCPACGHFFIAEPHRAGVEYQSSTEHSGVAQLGRATPC